MNTPRFLSTPVLIVAILTSSAPTRAQDRDQLIVQINATKAFLLKQRSADSYRNSIRQSAIAYENVVNPLCKTVQVGVDSTEVRDRILALLEVNDKSVATAGSWRESVPSVACGEKRLSNVQVDVTPHGLRFTPTFPGDAAGNPELQNDTLKNIEMNFAMLKIETKKSCHTAVIDTHLVGAPSAVSETGVMSPWDESWDVQSCGTVYLVPVTYTPDARGTHISIGTSQIRPR